jgi:acyl-CoA thioester hydrolase
VAVEHRERTRVAWIDTDAGGRIHFTAVFRWVEAAEAGLRRRLEILDDWDAYPRRHVEVDFLAVLRFEDEIEVVLAPRAVGRSSITWDWHIARNGETCVTGSHTVVHVDAAGRPAPLPEPVRAALG